jgi:hypothetical protein
LHKKLGPAGFIFRSNPQKAEQIRDQIVYHQASGNLRAQARMNWGQANQEKENQVTLSLLGRLFPMGRHLDESSQTHLTAEGHWDNR